jgi:hypothetical protein
MRGHEAEKAIMRQNERCQIIGKRVAGLLGAAALSLALVAPAVMFPVAARAAESVDGTALTPPVKPGTPCFADGRWIRCETGFTASWANEPAFELPCGTVYESAMQVRRSTRWYLDRLLVERNATESIRGTWSLSATGVGPSAEIRVNDGWHEHFVIPGDLSSDVEAAHGSFLRVLGLGNDILDVGIYLPDAHHGYTSITDESNIFDGTDPAGAAALCAVLSP